MIRTNKPSRLLGAWLLFGSITLSISALADRASADEPVLLADLPISSFSNYCCNAEPAASMAFCLAYGFNGFSFSGPPVAADAVIGCDLQFASGQTGFHDFNSSNSPDFDVLVTRLTDSVEEMFTVCDISLKIGGNLTLPSGCGSGLDTETFPNLAGSKVDFIRLVVNNVQFSTIHDSFGNTWHNAEWDVVWQFWSGPPHAGSRAENFLTYTNPLQKNISFNAAASSSFDVTITYGATIDPSSFKATLNGKSFLGFNPIAGESETLHIPLSRRHNKLVLKVKGTRSDGRMVTDRDVLRFTRPK